MPLLGSGKSLAGYRLIELAGEGGMGRVYRAVQPGIERVVALKVIRPELGSDQAFRERFEVESRLAASIDHPHVLPIYGAGEADEVLYVAMRWVEGRDLRRLLADEGPLEPARAVELLGQLADGLDAAHAGGLIHRDIKPANVLLEGDDAFLSDFGLARTTSGGDETTQVGGLVGTVDYLAPELVDGGTATPASDIYALGCVFFQMLTGSVPFPVDSLIAKLNAHTGAEPPAPSALRPELPRGFDAVLARALAKDPQRRPRSAAELAEAARRALRSAPPGERRPKRRRLAMAAAGALAVAAIAAATILALGGGSKSSPDRTGAAGAPFPRASSLSPCANLLTAPPGPCRDSNGGVVVLARQGQTAHMRTLDFAAERVFETGAIVEPTSRDTVTAPPGERFVVIEASAADRLPTARKFEPDQFAGRQAALYIYGSDGKRLPPSGPHLSDYSAQNLPAAGLVPLALAGLRLPPPHPAPIPLFGALVFAYPAAELRQARTMLLFVGELGGGGEARGSVGVFRLAPEGARRLKFYEGEGV